MGSAEIQTTKNRIKDGWGRSRLCHFVHFVHFVKVQVSMNFEGLEMVLGLASSSCALAQATPWSLECAPMALRY